MFILRGAKETDQERITHMLIGAPTAGAPTVVDETAGFAPPAWWKGDDYATRSGIAASATLRRRV